LLFYILLIKGPWNAFLAFLEANMRECNGCKATARLLIVKADIYISKCRGQYYNAGDMSGSLKGDFNFWETAKAWQLSPNS